MEHSTNMIGAAAIARGAGRLLTEMGYAVLAEFPLVNGRRVDLAGLDRGGRFSVVEVKSSVADFRSDGKWREYLAFADAFYFAVDAAFPRDRIPDDVGLIVADAYEGAVVRAAAEGTMNAARRRAQTLRFARTAAARLGAATDPRAGGWT